MADNVEDGGAAPAAIVTGAGSGIGRATAVELGRRGLHVVAVGRTRETLDATCDAVRGDGGSAEAVTADVGADDTPAAVVAALGDRRVGALVHAAAHHDHQTFVDTTPVAFDRQVAVNLRGPFFLTQALVPRFADGAGVVFVGSITSERARDHHIAYAATKAALLGLTTHLAAELAPGVRVNCVSPGATATAMLNAYVDASTAGLSEDEQRRRRITDKARLLLGRVADPSEVAATIVHLALDATAVTGVDVAVDVGYKAS
ncbi:MAG: SDR family oxidoreductase [Actinomycetota bacterium]|nr:SDR family oxidoreductase [Actinomycetota bacterium]